MPGKFVATPKCRRRRHSLSRLSSPDCDATQAAWWAPIVCVRTPHWHDSMRSPFAFCAPADELDLYLALAESISCSSPAGRPTRSHRDACGQTRTPADHQRGSCRPGARCPGGIHRSSSAAPIICALVVLQIGNVFARSRDEARRRTRTRWFGFAQLAQVCLSHGASIERIGLASRRQPLETKRELPQQPQIVKRDRAIWFARLAGGGGAKVQFGSAFGWPKHQLGCVGGGGGGGRKGGRKTRAKQLMGWKTIWSQPESRLGAAAGPCRRRRLCRRYVSARRELAARRADRWRCARLPRRSQRERERESGGKGASLGPRVVVEAKSLSQKRLWPASRLILAHWTAMSTNSSLSVDKRGQGLI